MSVADPSLFIIEATGGAEFSIFLLKCGIVLHCGVDLGFDLKTPGSRCVSANETKEVKGGACAHEIYEFYSAPRVLPLKLSTRVLTTSCGENHCAFLDSECRVIVWGNNVNGQCLFNESLGESIVAPPQYLDSSLCVRQVSCCASHTMLLSYASCASNSL